MFEDKICQCSYWYFQVKFRICYISFISYQEPCFSKTQWVIEYPITMFFLYFTLYVRQHKKSSNIVIPTQWLKTEPVHVRVCVCLHMSSSSSTMLMVVPFLCYERILYYIVFVPISNPHLVLVSKGRYILNTHPLDLISMSL